MWLIPFPGIIFNGEFYACKRWGSVSFVDNLIFCRMSRPVYLPLFFAPPEFVVFTTC
jgi:hypothetical protein